MAFIAGKGFAILNSKAEKGDAKAKELLSKLDSIDQDEADRLFSEILGKKGGGGSKKEKKTKAPGASATDGQGEITEGAGEQAPTGKATPKAKGEAPVAAPDAPTGEVKPKGKDYQLEIDDLNDKLSEIRQGRMDGDADEIRARIKELKGKKKAQGKAEPKGKVEPKAKKQKDLISQYDDRGLDFLDELGDEFDPETKRKVANEYLQELQDQGQEFQGDTYDRENVYDRLLKTGNKTGNNNNQKSADPLGADAFNAGYNDMLQQLSSSYGQKKNPEDDPLSNDNLKDVFDEYAGDVDAVLDHLRTKNIPMTYGEIQDVVEGFAAGYKYDPREATEKIKKGVGQVIQGNIQSDIEPDFQAIADEFGITKEEVIDVYNNQLEQNDAAKTPGKPGDLQTALFGQGAGPAPAGAFGDIEPETQQLAGIQSKEPIGEELVDEDTIGIVSRDYNPQVPRDGGLYKSGISTWQAEGKNGGAILNEEEDGSFSVTQFDKDKNEFSTLFYDDFETAKQYAQAATMQDAKTRKGPNSLKDFIKEDEDFAKEFAQLDEQGNELKNLTPDEQDRIDFELETSAEESKTKPITNADVQRLVELTGGTKEQVTQALDQKGANFSSEVQIFQPDSGLQKVYADPRQQIDDIMQTGRGGVSEQEAQQIAAEFGISVDEVRKLERQSQSEIAFPAPDQGEPIPADQDFDEQGNPIGNINDKEVADELGVDEQQLGELLFPNPTYNKRNAPWEPENIKEILAQTGGDKAKALEILKQQQSAYKGPRLENKFLPGIIDQVAAGETNPSLPASEPTAEQLAETNVLFEDTAETSTAEPAQELNKLQGLLPLSLKEAGIDESTPTAERGPKYRELINQLSNLEKKRPDLSKEINVLFEKLSSELDQVIAGNNAGAKPAQASAQIKQTAQANAQAAGVQQKPQSQQPAAGKTDRKKVEAAAVELGINADLLEGLLELIKRVK